MVEDFQRGVAMEARWPRPAPSASPSSSPLLELADELWFCSSVISLPSFSLPSFPSRPRRPDPSTLLAQLMLSTTRPRRRSRSPPPLPPLQPQQSFEFSDGWDPSSSDDDYGYGDYDPENDDCRNADEIFRPPPALEDVEDYQSEDKGLNSVPADCNHEDACSSHSEGEVASDGEDEEHADMIEKNQFEDGEAAQELAVPATVSTNLEVEDAVSGLYDVGVLLKGQQCRGFERDKRGIKSKDELDVVLPKEWSRKTPLKFVQVNTKSKDMTHVDEGRDVDVTCTVPYADKSVQKRVSATSSDSLSHLEPVYRQVLYELSSTEQDKMKEHLKFWAQIVASALHAKVVLQTKQVCDN